MEATNTPVLHSRSAVRAALQISASLSPAARSRFFAHLAEDEKHLVYATRLTDGQPVALYRDQIRYGRPNATHTARTAMLSLVAAPGLVPYEVALLGNKFSAEIRID